MLFGQRDSHVERRVCALNEAIDPVGAELRLVEVADFIAYIHAEQFANIQDIVNSSVEPFFKPGTLSFGWAADFELDWTRPPSIFLDMEFHRHEIWIVFKLILRALETRVAITFVSFETSSGNADQDTARFIEVIADARLPCRGC